MKTAFVLAILVAFAAADCDYTAYGQAGQAYATCEEGAAGDQSKICGCMSTYESALTGQFASCPGASSAASAIANAEKSLGCSADAVSATEDCDYTAYGQAGQAYATCEEAAAGDDSKICGCMATYLTALTGQFASCPGASSAAAALQAAEKSLSCSVSATEDCDYTAYGQAGQAYATCEEAAAGDDSKMCACIATYLTALTGQFASCPGASSAAAALQAAEKSLSCSVSATEDCDYSAYGQAGQTYATCEEGAAGDKTKICGCMSTYESALTGQFASCPGASSAASAIANAEKSLGCSANLRG